MRLLSSTLSTVALALVAGCAQAPARVAPPPSSPASPVVPVRPVAFSALLLSLEGCPSGQALFAVPWEHSPEYDPAIRFIRAPNPVPTCVELPASLARAYLGRTVSLEKVGGRYRLHVATTAVPSN